MPGRRGKFEIYRDVLLAIEASAGKLTHIMRWTGISYRPMLRLLEEMKSRKLIDTVDAEDGRSNNRFVITTKGKYVRSLLAETIDYIEDQYSEPDLREEPPVWILRKVIARKGFELEPPKVVEALPELALPELPDVSEPEEKKRRVWSSELIEVLPDGTRVYKLVRTNRS